MPWLNGGGARLINKMSARKNVDAEFQKQYGMPAFAYVSAAQTRALRAMGSTGANFGARSRDGQKWTTTAYVTQSPSQEVVAYHDAEERAKQFAQQGDFAQAIEWIDKALERRVKYEERLTTDQGHEHHKTVLRQRRKSMSNLLDITLQNDVIVVEARQTVTKFYFQHQMSPPDMP